METNVGVCQNVSSTAYQLQKRPLLFQQHCCTMYNIMPTFQIFHKLQVKPWQVCIHILKYMWLDNKVCKLVEVKVLHTSLLNTTVVAFKVPPLGSYAPMPAPSPPFKTILELVLWNGLQSCRCITPDVIKMPSFQYILYLGEQKKVTGG